MPVPPDVVAFVPLRARRALGGLDPVDVVEPVGLVALGARVAVDRLDEPAAVRRADLDRALQRLHHRSVDLRVARVTEPQGPEVLRDADVDALGGDPGAEPAPRASKGDGDGGDCGSDPAWHRLSRYLETTTVAAAERISPSLEPTSDSLPARLPVTVATPLALVVPLTPGKLTPANGLGA